ncbi:peptidoglycan DD-metalloendopeptidase family protein [Chitinimonas sp. JJ19]|uniref:peptidoglycan DD-metalloendopeptidase family protein n=1 Tax=Chitinimonas sp. JJ19 TaxID=3109352 RepID=UPI00300044F2
MQKHAFTPLAALLAGLYLSLPAHAGPAPDAALRHAATTALADKVKSIAADAAPAGDTIVEIHKRSGAWVLGSATQVLFSARDDIPVSRLFIARQSGGKWQVGMEGSSTFFTLLGSVPASVMSAPERDAFRAQRTVMLKQQMEAAQPMASTTLLAGETGLGLPWAEGVAWYMGGGPHGNSGNSRPFDSIDFNGGNGQVLAPRDGRIYKSCVRNSSAIVQLVHDNGYTSRYYHMVNLPNLADGTLVRKGAYLGQIGNGLPCGGSTTGPHVHFSISMNGQPVAVNGKTIGGWQFFEGASAYQGYALRNGRRVNPGGSLVNYGSGDVPPQPGKTVTVKTSDPNLLINVRTAPNLQSTVVRTVRNGDRVQIVCHANGDWVNGTWGRTSLWNRLDTGHWISDGFLDTGSNQAVVPACTALK